MINGENLIKKNQSIKNNKDNKVTYENIRKKLLKVKEMATQLVVY